MVTTYKMKEKEFYKWFDRLYKIRHKWCTGLSKDFFSTSILSSKRSESTNSATGIETKKTTSLTNFSRFSKTQWKDGEKDRLIWNSIA